MLPYLRRYVARLMYCSKCRLVPVQNLIGLLLVCKVSADVLIGGSHEFLGHKMKMKMKKANSLLNC